MPNDCAMFTWMPQIARLTAAATALAHQGDAQDIDHLRCLNDLLETRVGVRQQIVLPPAPPTPLSALPAPSPSPPLIWAASIPASPIAVPVQPNFLDMDVDASGSAATTNSSSSSPPLFMTWSPPRMDIRSPDSIVITATSFRQAAIDVGLRFNTLGLRTIFAVCNVLDGMSVSQAARTQALSRQRVNRVLHNLRCGGPDHALRRMHAYLLQAERRSEQAGA